MSTYQQQAPARQQPASIATASVVLGAVGFVVGICSVIGLILGLMAHGKAKRGEISSARVKTGIVVSTISLVLGVIGWIILFAALGAGTNAATTATSSATTSASASAPATPEAVSVETSAPVETAPSVPATSEAAPVVPAVKPTEDVSVAQKNAVRKAESYLETSSFSRSGLIDQLQFEDFSAEDATFAVDNITVDWNEQAAKKAASYLETSSFSRQGLIDQLTFEGFSASEAEYGVSQTGL